MNQPDLVQHAKRNAIIHMYKAFELYEDMQRMISIAKKLDETGETILASFYLYKTRLWESSAEYHNRESQIFFHYASHPREYSVWVNQENEL